MPVYYHIDLRKASMREFAFGTPWPQLPIIGLIKFLRIPIPASADDPPVETLTPFEADEAALPADVRGRFAGLADDFKALGFHSPIYHVIPDPLHGTQHYWATYLH